MSCRLMLIASLSRQSTAPVCSMSPGPGPTAYWLVLAACSSEGADDAGEGTALAVIRMRWDGFSFSATNRNLLAGPRSRGRFPLRRRTSRFACPAPPASTAASIGTLLGEPRPPTPGCLPPRYASSSCTSPASGCCASCSAVAAMSLWRTGRAVRWLVPSCCMSARDDEPVMSGDQEHRQEPGSRGVSEFLCVRRFVELAVG